MNKKTIWITGGSTGIGKALAIKFASKGWNVAVSARREELLNELSDQYENISAFPLDVTDKQKCAEVFDQIKKKYEDIDICFFSTGTWNPKKEKEIDVEQIEEVFKINFFGTVNTIKAVEQYFRDRKKGTITIVSSIAGYRGLPNSTGYGPSKSALNNLAESLYFDFKRFGVRVCLVSPGFIKTPMTDKNDFKMPFIKTTDYAANKIYDGLINKNVFEIHFPKSLTIILKILSFLPSKLYFSLVGQMTKYQKK
ncbi:SDR family NAD(P)-dependent oxidoreductase [Candidatus Pelagibacter sp.]|jgi:short-subunit dehydrogenase|nr:SDR family NAD(P)-dependent oxidoreductase [Candidatus Pelagibacter sp.]MDC0417084.1 SDR family NAD(P)-dependent oxidoreductase [Candidatus Pelagibacter sp.]MDC0597685.1 SDR family NAD(P)-dependent oxidoreductase [Candidatus Pelagibacter sp.]MDC3384973.1 SDR family NAD(P)-dependent oxidoreductase [Candidatus Pelagibacter sp.]NDG89643.1 SDR family NAD(P)-dependent oxidoreductase [Pseudomonadota bacterium]